MGKPLTPDDLAAYLAAHGIRGEVLRLSRPTPTVTAAAEVMGVSPEQILKTVVFMVADRPVLVIARGLGRIDTRALARQLGVPRKAIRVAKPAEVLEATGYPAGGVPPVGHRRALPILVDRQVLGLPLAYAGGGAVSALLRIAPADLLAATRATVVDVQPSAASGQ